MLKIKSKIRSNHEYFILTLEPIQCFVTNIRNRRSIQNLFCVYSVPTFVNPVSVYNATYSA